MAAASPSQPGSDPHCMAVFCLLLQGTPPPAPHLCSKGSLLLLLVFRSGSPRLPQVLQFPEQSLHLGISSPHWGCPWDPALHSPARLWGSHLSPAPRGRPPAVTGHSSSLLSSSSHPWGQQIPVLLGPGSRPHGLEAPGAQPPNLCSALSLSQPAASPALLLCPGVTSRPASGSAPCGQRLVTPLQGGLVRRA